MKRSNKKTISAVVGVILITALFYWLGYSSFNDDTYTTNIALEQGDTRIQQEIHLGTYSVDKKYYICTYIEVYNSGWKEAKRWHDYATVDQVVYVKAMQRKFAEEASVEIRKAVREFYYGKEDSNEKHSKGQVESTGDRGPSNLIYYEACLSQDDATYNY